MVDADDLNIENFKIPGVSGFDFSAIKVNDLSETKYTLATVIIDISGSVTGFKTELENCLKEIIKACKKSPNAENILVRVLYFNDKTKEIHGFIPINNIDENSYNSIYPSGMTDLYGATYSGIGSALTYGKSLFDQEFIVNSICFVITDGGDNINSINPSEIKKKINDAKNEEWLESSLMILIAIGNDTKLLNLFNLEAGFDQYIEIKNANKDSLSKLANFVSKSISSQSQSLGTGGPSQSLSF